MFPSIQKYLFISIICVRVHFIVLHPSFNLQLYNCKLCTLREGVKKIYFYHEGDQTPSR